MLFNVTGINVQWAWLSYFAVLTASALALFTLFLWQTRQRPDHCLLRSSSLPVLFYFLDHSLQAMVRAESTREEIVQVDREVHVELREVADSKPRLAEL